MWYRLLTLTAIACLAALLALEGCSNSGNPPDTQANTLLAQLNEYNRLHAAQDWSGALAVARNMVAKKGTAPLETRVNLRIILIGALANYGNYVAADHAGMDQEALARYKEAIAFAGESTLPVAQVNQALGLYYSYTDRNGLALPYFRKAIRYFAKAGDKFQVINGYASLAAVFADRGEGDVSSFFRWKALTKAADYFQVGSSPPASAGQEWIAYGEILKLAAADAADRGDLEQLRKLWSLIKRVSDTYYKYKFKTNFAIAPQFARAGDKRRARTIFADGRRKLDAAENSSGHPLQWARTEMACSEAMMEWAGRKYEHAAGLYDRCLNGLRKIKRPPDEATFVDQAQSFEIIGEFERALVGYDKAIKIAETARSSYPVADRAAFFGNPVSREPYWGRIRILAERAAYDKTRASFFGALSATERIRARQFGDFLLGSGEVDIAPQKLERFAAGLGDETVVLGYTVMSDRIVILAFTRTKHTAVTVPIDGGRFAADLFALHTLLANPASDLTDNENRLRAASRTILGPVAQLVLGKGRILVLPDGAINLIPFGLLSVSRKGYVPLLQHSVIRVLPSLRIELKLQVGANHAATSGLFAVGDPAFDAAPAETMLSKREMAQISRGSPYLQYFNRLPGTRREVQGIAKIMSGQKVRVLLGRQATESAIENADLRPFGYLHFATHGVLGGQIPGLNQPALVFAREKGKDGFLTATEASKLHLDAELTVLSACNTGSGKLLAGEGVLSMSRAFLLAGSRSVVVSLWPVADKSTARLMQLLYRNKLKHMPTADALRAAELAIRKTLPHPAFWAPFIVVGD